MTEPLVGRRNRRLAAGLIAVGVVCVGALVIPNLLPKSGDPVRGPGPSSASSGATTPPSGQASPSGSGAASEVPPIDVTPPPADDAILEARVQVVLERASEALGEEPSVDVLDGVATGAFRTMLELQLEEWSDADWHQVGSPTVSDVAVEDEKDDNTLIVSACVDSSDVKVLDENGVNVRDESTPNRSRMLFTLEPRGGQWMIADQTFPDDPAC
ncbi:MAG: hypothetical protein IPJ61_14315 [Tessaracoccus sp.]|uniref:hypothetical protein n=1 Tax=Tessaracoccus sp. TaxID=1971211 RepID=UPI001ED56018|nr:hypothetical protein [Tessaracoccus sp.]MBK7822187.1 hypothetical protein [Tessaracoccus sp.]